MIFSKFKSIKRVNINIAPYIIDWQHSPSKEQQILQDFLYPYWKHKVVLAEFRIPGSLLRCDIMNVSDRIMIEYSPEGTHDWNPWFHKDRNSFMRRVKADIDKIDWGQKNNFKVIELNKYDLSCLSRSYFAEKFNIQL